MSSFVSVREGIAACIFLALYVVFTGFTSYIVYLEGWKSRFTFLLIFGVIRVGGQLCGVAFSKLGITHWQWLIAYLVLSAEGYFTLVLTSFHFLAKAQTAVVGTSWIKPTSEEIKEMKYTTNKWKARFRQCTPANVFHWILIPANAILIAGGTMLTGIDPAELANEQGKVNTSKALRCVGQAIFLGETVILVILSLYVYKKERVRVYTLYALFFAYPFLLVRGIFGVMSIFLNRMNYYLISNYDGEGLSSYFIACEYCLATTTEFISACALISVYYHDKRYGPLGDRRGGEKTTYIVDEESDGKEEKEEK